MERKYSEILDPLWDASLSGTKPELLKDTQRHIIEIQNFEHQVYSSYIGDLFYNGGGKDAYSVLSALKAIGSVDIAGIVEKAISLFPVQPVPHTHAECRDIMDVMEEEGALDPISDQWQELTDAYRSSDEDLMDLKMDYIRSHADDFDLFTPNAEPSPVAPLTGRAEYYVLQQDWDYARLKSEEPFDPYIGEPLNLGIKMKPLPKITLKFKSKALPDFIPNGNGCVVANQKIISLFKESGADYIQYFDIDVEDKEGNVITDDYKCLNVLKVIDAIDAENSGLEWSELYEGETEEDRYLRGMKHLKLNYEAIDNEPLFRLKKFEMLLLVREDIAQTIVNNRLTGLEFYPAEGYRS